MFKTILYISLIGLLSISVNAYELTGDNLIEPRFYEGNLLIYNEGRIAYSIYSGGFYCGTITNNQGMYLNESLDYKLYALTNPVSDITVENVEKKINQYWYIGLIAFILILFGVAIIRVFFKR
jgi:hypothetical protein